LDRVSVAVFRSANDAAVLSVMGKDAEAWPGLKSRFPEVPWKSMPALAVPSWTEYETVAGELSGPSRTTVIVAWPDDSAASYCQVAKCIAPGGAKGMVAV